MTKIHFRRFAAIDRRDCKERNKEITMIELLLLGSKKLLLLSSHLPAVDFRSEMQI